MKRKSFLKTLTLYLTVALLMLSVSVPAFASVPSRPSNQYVLDSAGVLSDATEQHIISENEKLFKECGGEIVIAAVDFLGGEEIDDYVYSMFNIWGVGSKERNNGILLVLAVAEDNYYAQAGYGIEDHFDGSLMQELLDDYLEDDFAAGDYDAGVKKFFDATLAELKAYEYDDDYDTDNYEQGGAYDNYDSDDYDIEVNFGALIRNIFLFVVRLVVIIIVVIIIIAIIRSASHGGGNGGSGGGFWTGMFLGSRMNRRRHWHNPPPPPPPGGFGGPMPGPGRRSTPPRPNRGGGGFGGFSGGSRPGGFSGGGRSGGRPSGGGRSGGFSRGGGSRGGGAGRR